MAETLRARGAGQQFAAGHLTRRLAALIALAGAVGLAYFLVAEVAAMGLVLQPGSIAVFCPVRKKEIIDPLPAAHQTGEPYEDTV